MRMAIDVGNFRLTDGEPGFAPSSFGRFRAGAGAGRKEPPGDLHRDMRTLGVPQSRASIDPPAHLRRGQPMFTRRFIAGTARCRSAC